MSGRLGIYDIFSRIVPGGVYLVTFVEFARITNMIQFEWAQLQEVGALASLGLALLAFIVGSAMNNLGSVWLRLFRPKEQVLEDFKNEHTNWQIEFQENDWAILRAYVYTQDLHVGEEVDRHNALSLMMQNVSLGLTLLATCEVFQLIRTRDWRLGVLAAVLMFFSYQTGIQACHMREWFYRSVFEFIIAYGLKVEDFVKSAKPAVAGKKAR